MATAMAGGSSARAESGVHIDPQSPAGVEYAVPLHSGRQPDARTPTGRSGSESHSQRLFGVGITPPRGPGSGSSRAARGSRDRLVSDGRAHRAKGTESASAGNGSAAQVSAPVNYSPTAPVMALIAAILLGGGGLGLLARRRVRSS